MTITRRGPRVEATTAESIRQAAITLFESQGYAATTLRQISDAVGLQVGSLYNHISSKEQLLYSIMHDSMSTLLADTHKAVAASDDPVEQVRAFIRAGIRFHTEHREQAHIGNSELRALSTARRRSIIRMRDEYQALLEGLLTAAVRSGRIHVPDVKLAAFAGIGICVHVSSWYRPGGRLTLEQVEEALLAAYAPALAPERT